VIRKYTIHAKKERTAIGNFLRTFMEFLQSQNVMYLASYCHRRKQNIDFMVTVISSIYNFQEHFVFFNKA